MTIEHANRVLLVVLCALWAIAFWLDARIDRIDRELARREEPERVAKRAERDRFLATSAIGIVVLAIIVLSERV